VLYLRIGLVTGAKLAQPRPARHTRAITCAMREVLDMDICTVLLQKRLSTILWINSKIENEKRERGGGR
jgi:hypothetical protein